MGSCIALAAKWSALRTPFQLPAGWGSRQRKLPTGGAAKGMPLKEWTPLASVTPSRRPLATLTRGAEGWAVGDWGGDDWGAEGWVVGDWAARGWAMEEWNAAKVSSERESRTSRLM